jgi:uncharacterized protein
VALRSSKSEIRAGRAPRASLRFGLSGVLALVILSAVFHEDVLSLFATEAAREAEAPAGPPLPASEAEEELTQFVAYVADHVQATFEREMTERGRPYAEAKVVYFTDRVRTPCGMSEVVSGSFYCAAERRAYVDLGLYRELRRRFGASGDFAEAYVLAHAMGHHLQNVQGIEERTRRQQARYPSRKDDLHERAELQADCYAGVWARIATERDLLHPGDLEMGMDAASRVGAELEERAERGRVLEPFTHGTRARRAQWFKRGFENGRLEACDTFAREAL